MEVILASQSSIRKAMFDDLDIPYKVIVSGADESFKEAFDSYEDQLKDISLRKADTVFEAALGECIGDCIIVGSDYMVVRGNDTDSEGHVLGDIYGKPHSEAEAKQFLKDFRNGPATCLCGTTVIVYVNGEKKVYQDIDSARLFIEDLSDDFIDNYVKNPAIYKIAAGFNIYFDFCRSFVSLTYGAKSTALGLHMGFVKNILEKYHVL